MSSTQDVISQLKHKYEKAYGFALLDLTIEENPEEVDLNGQVLTSKQKEEVLSEMAKATGKRITGQIGILTDLKSRELGWAAVKAPLADLRSRFVPSALLNERIRNRVRSSQLSRGEVLRVLYQQEDQLLVQSADLTTGWIKRSEVTRKKESLRPLWRTGTFAAAGHLTRTGRPVAGVITAAEKFLGVRYALGGRSERAIDCSALTQLAYRRACDIVLPRHSWDQKKMGVVVDLSAAVTGDLVFMLNKMTGTKHVGIWESVGEERNIIHASSADKKVVRQSAQEVFKKYELVEVRRIVKK